MALTRMYVSEHVPRHGNEANRSLCRKLLSIVPQPTKAVILLFPDVPEAKAHQKEEDERIARDGQPHLDPTIFYVKQTVRWYWWGEESTR